MGYTGAAMTDEAEPKTDPKPTLPEHDGHPVGNAGEVVSALANLLSAHEEREDAKLNEVLTSVTKLGAELTFTNNAVRQSNAHYVEVLERIEDHERRLAALEVARAP